MAVSIVIDITQNSQNIANNTSNVTVKVNAKWTGGSYNLLEKSGSCTIDGTTYTFTSPFNTGRTTSGSGNLFTKTLNITHGSDGKKTLAVSASYTSGVSSGTVSASASKVLTTIPRKSTLSVANGTLGTAQTLTVTRQATSFTHTITYTCGNQSGTICTKSSSTSISFTPPLSLASQNTSGTSVSITYTITTYNGSTSVGSNSYTKTCSIPSSVKPSCTVTVDDVGTMLYGLHLQGLAQLKITVKPTVSYGSPIASYKTVVNGKTYTAASFTTDILNVTGALTITSTVTDNRGRSGSTTQTIQIEPYFKPKFNTARAFRAIMVNGVGEESPIGDLIFVEFTSAAKAIFGANVAKFSIEYKKASDPEYTICAANQTIPEATMENFSLGGFIYGFPADTGSSYEVSITLSDDIDEVTRKIPVSSAAVFMSWHDPEGNGNFDGIAFGKVAEESELFDVGWDARFNKPVYGKVVGLDRLPYIPNGDNLDDYKITGCWAIYSNSSDNQPSRADKIYCGDKLLGTDDTVPPARAARFEVISSTGEGVRETQWSYLRQRFIPYNAENAVLERDVTRSADNVWRYYEWHRTTLTPEAAQKVYSKAAMSIALSANTVLGTVNTYTKIPFDKSVLSTNNRLTLSSNAIRIGAGIQHIKVNGQVLVSPSSTDGLRHVRIQKVSGSTISSVAWSTLYFTGSRHLMHVMTPLIVSVKEGDLLQMVFYTGNANDSISSGTAANGYQTYLTVEEL